MSHQNSHIINLQSITLVRNKTSILSDISWTIKSGEHWVLMGRNGSGKTMLLKIISGYLWPTSGTVEVLGKKFGEVDIRELRKHIGWVSSDLQFQLQQNITALEVVLSGYFATIGLYDKLPKLLRSLKKRAGKLMELMGISHLSSHLFPTLSFGEQKRVLIARALMHQPQLLILDEPCTGLDIKAREEFLPFIEELGKKKNGPTMIMTTHHIEEIMPVFSHVLALKTGKIVKKGKKGEILKQDILKEIFGISLEVSLQKERYSIKVS